MTRNAMSLALLGVLAIGVLVLMFADFSADPAPMTETIQLNAGN